MLPVKPYTVAVPASGSYQQLATGRYFRIQSCTNPVTVSIDGVGTLGSIAAGQGFRIPADAPAFGRLNFIETSGAINNVTFIVADSDFVDNTVLGSVSVIDGEKARTLAGAQFGGSITAGSSAGNPPKTQLWNPVGSGKNLIVRSVLISASAAAVNTLFHGLTATQLANAGAGVNVAASKLIGGTIGVGQMRTEDTAGGAGVLSYLHQATFPASVAQVFQAQIFGAIVVPPGKGLNASCSVTGIFLSASWEWFEESQ